MIKLANLFNPSPRMYALALAVISLGVSVTSVLLTSWLKLQPCPLCIFQRFLYLAILLPALLVLVFPMRIVQIFSNGLIALLSLGGFVTASYQSWMQLYPEQATGCGASQPNLIEKFVDWLSNFSDFFLATGSCSSKEWVFLGLSIANWSVLVYLGLLCIALLAVWRGLNFPDKIDKVL